MRGGGNDGSGLIGMTGRSPCKLFRMTLQQLKELRRRQPRPVSDECPRGSAPGPCAPADGPGADTFAIKAFVSGNPHGFGKQAEQLFQRPARGMTHAGMERREQIALPVAAAQTHGNPRVD